MHCVVRQNKLETPKEKDEVNKREVHECDVRTSDPDAMVVPPTPKLTCKSKPSPGRRRPSPQVKETLVWRSGIYHSSFAWAEILKLNQKSAVPQQRPRPYVPTRISTGHPPHPNHTPTHHTNVMDKSDGRFVVYYESIKRELKIRCIYECRWDERLQKKLRNLHKIETRLIDEKFANAMGEYVT